MRRTVKIVAIVVALLLVVVISVPFLISADRFRPMLESKLSAALGRKVTIGSLRLSLVTGAISADGLAIADDEAFSRAPFLQAKSLKIGVEMWPLIASRRLNVTALTIDGPQVILLQAPDGRWNYSSLGGKAETPPSAAPQASAGGSGLDLSVRLVRITGGRFSIGKTAGGQRPLALENVKLEVRDFAPSVRFPFELSARVASGGDIKLAGEAGPIEFADTALTPFSVELDVAKLNLAAALAGTAPGLAGTAGVQANAQSRKGQLTTTGKVWIDGLELAKNGKPARKPVQFDFVNEYDLSKRAGVLRRGNIGIGSAIASLTGTYAERGDLPVLSAKFLATKLPVQELAELLPPLNIELPKGSRLEGGTANADFVIEGPTNQLVAAGSVSLENTRLANFDLGTKMAVVQMLAGIKRGPDTDIEILSAKLKHTPSGTLVEGLRFIAKGIGELNGSGTISPASALDFKMNATVQTTRSALISRTAVPFFVRGTASDPVFRADVSGLAAGQAKTLLETEASKRLKGKAGEAAAGILENLFGRKKKQDEAK